MPQLRVMYEPVEPYRYISNVHDEAGAATEQGREFSIGIENLSGKSIHGVRVQVVHMQGMAHNGREVNDSTPFTLQLDDTGAGAGDPWALLQPFTVDPTVKRYVHVVQKRSLPADADLDGALTFFLARKSALPLGDYVFTIDVSGNDVRAVDGPKQFHVGFGENQELTFEPLTSS